MPDEKNEENKNSVEELVHESIEDFKKALLAGIDKSSNKEYADIKGLIDTKFEEMSGAVKAARKKSIIISGLSIFISVFVIGMVFAFFTHGDRTASKEINEQTQHNLRTIVNLVGEKQMEVVQIRFTWLMRAYHYKPHLVMIKIPDIIEAMNQRDAAVLERMLVEHVEYFVDRLREETMKKF